MVLDAILALALVGAPAGAPLAPLPAPLGHFGDVLEPSPGGGLPQGERAVALAGCEARTVYVMRMLGGAARTLEQLQGWMDRSPGLERRLFRRARVLAEVMRTLGAGRYEARSSCSGALPLEAPAAPKRWCPAGEGPRPEEHWFFTGKAAAAVVVVEPGATDPCRPRISVVLFDARGQARLRVHADWSGAASASLLGDRCQRVDFAFDAATQAFLPSWKSCKP